MMGIMGIKEKFLELNKRNFDNAEVINILLYIIICFIPMIMRFEGSDKYSMTKALFLWGIGIIIFFLMVREKVKNYDRIEKLIIIFLILATISTINSMSFFDSLFGSYLRWEGIITLYMYGVLFIAAKRYFVLKCKWINLFIGSGLILTIYLLFQANGIDPLRGHYLDGVVSEQITIGNRNFVSSYILIFLGFSMSGYVFFKKKALFIESLIFFSGIIYTQTRGGWVALIIVFMILLLIVIKDKKRIKRMIILGISFIIIFNGINIIKNGQITNRLESIKTDITNFSGNSGSGRIDIYRATLMTIKNHFFTGTGPDALFKGINELPSGLGFYWEEKSLNIDKAHNEILNYAATLGIPAAIVYVILISLIIKKIIINFSDDKFKVIFIIILLYLIQANLNISVVDVASIFWIILGIGANPEIIKNLKMEDKEKNVIM